MKFVSPLVCLLPRLSFFFILYHVFPPFIISPPGGLFLYVAYHHLFIWHTFYCYYNIVSFLFGSMNCVCIQYINTHPSVALTGGKKIPYHCLLGTIEFDNVSFSYPTRPGQVKYSCMCHRGNIHAILTNSHKSHIEAKGLEKLHFLLVNKVLKSCIYTLKSACHI